jgi:hypothetical protein
MNLVQMVYLQGQLRGDRKCRRNDKSLDIISEQHLILENPHIKVCH